MRAAGIRSIGTGPPHWRRQCRGPSPAAVGLRRVRAQTGRARLRSSPPATPDSTAMRVRPPGPGEPCGDRCDAHRRAPWCVASSRRLAHDPRASSRPAPASPPRRTSRWIPAVRLPGRFRMPEAFRASVSRPVLGVRQTPSLPRPRQPTHCAEIVAEILSKHSPVSAF